VPREERSLRQLRAQGQPPGASSPQPPLIRGRQERETEHGSQVISSASVARPLPKHQGSLRLLRALAREPAPLATSSLISVRSA